MIIALDYDDCYTREPILWKKFIIDAQKLSHVIVCVTMRRPTEEIKDMPCQIIYTSREAKRQYCEKNDVIVDIWIDDNPASIYHDMI